MNTFGLNPWSDHTENEQATGALADATFPPSLWYVSVHKHMKTKDFFFREVCEAIANLVPSQGFRLDRNAQSACTAIRFPVEAGALLVQVSIFENHTVSIFENQC